MSILLKAAVGAAAQPIYADNVFSTYLYTGNGSTQTITNGIDLAGEGGLVWIKLRNDAWSHNLIDTIRGGSKYLSTDNTAAESTDAQGITSINSDGFTVGSGNGTNQNAKTVVSWTFRKAPKFFDVQTVTKSASSNATVNLSTLGTVGMVAVKRTDSTGSWYVWHRSLTSGKLLYLEQTAAEATLGHITVSGTTLTLVDGVIADGSYIVYAWAHDTGTDGIIQCGTFTTDGSGNATVSLGWEIQYAKLKASSTTGNWITVDSMRGMPVGSNDQQLYPNLNSTETAGATLSPTATGFDATGLGASQTYVYLAIRLPNKPPTTGTQVYNAIARTGTGAAATVTGVGFAPDAALISNRTQVTASGHRFFDRLRGAPLAVITSSTSSETNLAQDLTAFNMDGVSLGTNGNVNGVDTYINWFFRRALGVFDVVCDTGTGSAHTVSHSLTVAPELMIRKSRSGATQWEVWHSGIANTEKLVLDSTAAKATDTTAWNSTSPTASVFTVGTGANVNTSSATYVTYLFATKAGISKVGSYTGNGTNQTINCGFTAGARFVLIKRTDSTGDWYVWDSVRGIIAANDPHLSLNSTAAEVTTDDSIDPDNSGFIVNQDAATNINVSSATYIFLAIA